jgi:hypothetical protein
MALLELQLQDKEQKIKLLESKLEQMRPCANIQVHIKETDDELTIETQHDQMNKIDKKYANHTPTKNNLKQKSVIIGFAPTSRQSAHVSNVKVIIMEAPAEPIFSSSLI